MVSRPSFVAEFTTNHMGNLNVLLRMAERAAEAGCDLIKMQKKDVERFYSREKLDSPYDSPYGHTYRDYRTMFEFGVEDFRRFDRRCRELGVGWFATVQDVASLEFMLGFDLPLYKVASTNARDAAFLTEVARQVPRDRGIVISVAGSTLREVEAAIERFPHHALHVLHCVARYPCPREELRLGNIETLRHHFADDRIRIGYSGHEEGISPSVAAADLGAAMIERHFCLSRHSFVHHIECSLEPAEFARLVRIVRGDGPLSPCYDELPDESFASSFGMSSEEREFLVEQTYGRRHVGDRSQFAGGVHDGSQRRRALAARSRAA